MAGGRYVELSPMTVTPHIERLVELALEEDLGRGDITTRAVLPEPGLLEGVITAKQKAVICGLDLAAYVFRKVDESIPLFREVFAKDSNWVDLTRRLQKPEIFPNTPEGRALVEEIIRRAR